MKQNKAEQK